MIRIFFSFVFAFVLFFAPPAQAAENAPKKVTIGAYVNDIQAIDLQSHSYRIDLYIWFRWTDPAIDPSKTAEFMNAFDPVDHVRTALYEKPLKMPDGSFYTVIREQGKFSAKFPLQDYPFDRQNLAVYMEDSLYTADELTYVPDDAGAAIVLSESVNDLPGFEVGTPSLRVVSFAYPTKFGDLTQEEATPYMRAVFEIPVSRPQVSAFFKIFLPIALVVFCTAMILFVHPAYVDGRLGVAITSLLTAVALQLTTVSGLPDVDYLMMIDKVYFMGYLYIISILVQVVRTSGLAQAKSYDLALQSDRKVLLNLSLAFAVGVILVLLA